MNIQTYAKHYTFEDGDKVITTKDPSEGFFRDLVSGREDKDPMDQVNVVLDYMLYEEDKHYINEVSYSVKLGLMKEYIEFHVAQLGDRFRNTSPKEYGERLLNK